MDENVRLTYSLQRAVAVVTKSSGGESLPGYDADACHLVYGALLRASGAGAPRRAYGTVALLRACQVI